MDLDAIRAKHRDSGYGICDFCCESGDHEALPVPFPCDAWLAADAALSATARAAGLEAIVTAARAYIAAHDAIDVTSEASVLHATDARFYARNALRAVLAEDA